MGTKVVSRRQGTAVYTITPGFGPVVQVAHPTDISWTPIEAVEMLLLTAEEFPRDAKLLLTGGGFISLSYPETVAKRFMLSEVFLQRLTAWTNQELHDVVETIRQSQNGRDFIIGVDVLVNGVGSGQFALWVGQSDHALVAKRFPVEQEDTYLAGVESAQPVHGRRIVPTSIGPALLLVCHDAQAFNHLTIARVMKAARITPRMRAIEEFHEARNAPGLKWALNLVHWVGGESNTRTFATSYSQIRGDYENRINVAASFGFEEGIHPMQVAELLSRMTSPTTLELPRIVFHYDIGANH